MEKAKQIIDSVRRFVTVHPVGSFVVAILLVPAWDVVGRVFVERTSTIWSVLMEWWQVVEVVFDHPVGETALIISAGGILYWLISKDRRDEKGTEDRLMIAREEATADVIKIVDDRLGKYDKRFGALFSHLTSERQIERLNLYKRRLQDHMTKGEGMLANIRFDVWDKERIRDGLNELQSHCVDYPRASDEGLGNFIFPDGQEQWSFTEDELKSRPTPRAGLIDDPTKKNVYVQWYCRCSCDLKDVDKKISEVRGNSQKNLTDLWDG